MMGFSTASVSKAARYAALPTLLAGLAVATALVVHFGAPAVLAALRAAGWAGLAAISAVHAVLIALMGLAWAVLGGRDASVSPLVFAWGRFVRDAGSEMLPLSQFGGILLGARAVIRSGAGGVVTAATTIIDVTLELCAQIAYTAIGLSLLAWLSPGTGLLSPTLIGLATAVAVVSAFIAVQRRPARILEHVMARVGQGWLAAVAVGTEAVEAKIRDIHRRPRRLSLCLAIHLATWLGSGAEAWLGLRLMGVTLGLAQVLVIESLLYAIRSVAFVVPNAIGVQEAAYVVLGASFGLAPDMALGLSLLKRGRDLLLGLPTLVAWQWLEGKRLYRRRTEPRRVGRRLS